MANLDTDTSPSSIPTRDQRGRVYDRPGGGGTKNNMAMIIGLILAAVAVVILLALLF